MSEEPTTSDGVDMSFVVNRKKKDVWQTPPRVWGPINDGLRDAGHDRIDLDPCPGEETRIARYNPRPSDGFNGLSYPWFGNVFLNPPFSEKERWFDKAISEYLEGNTLMTFIISPDSMNVKSWYHGLIAPYASHTWFPEGRVEYELPEGSEYESGSGVSFGTAVHVLGGEMLPKILVEYWNNNGDLVRRDTTFGRQSLPDGDVSEPTIDVTPDNLDDYQP